MDYNTIINEINNNVLEAIKISLRPLWEKIEQQTMNYQTIVGIMRNMPEFKELQDENIRLKEMLNKEKEMTHAQSNCINLEVIENRTYVDEDKIDDKVKLIYSDVKLIPKENSVHVRNVCPDAESSQEDEVSEAAEEEEASEADQEASEADQEASEADQEASEAADEVVEEADQEASEAADEVVEEASEADEAASSEAADEVVEASSEAAEEESEEEDAPAPTQERSATSAEEEEEVFIVEIEDFGDVYTNDENNGTIYKIDQDDDVGEKIGYFKDGVPVFENV